MQGTDRQGKAKEGKAMQTWHDKVWHAQAKHGKQGMVSNARQARHGKLQQGKAT
jgi:hypothetical protein